MKLFSIFFLIFLMLIQFVAAAQPGGGDPGGDPDVPISGIELLVALGALFGVSRFFGKKKSKGVN